MTVCKYEILSAKNNEEFKTINTQEIRTLTELQAYKIINKWNKRMSSVKDIKLKYILISCRYETKEDKANMKLCTEDNC